MCEPLDVAREGIILHLAKGGAQALPFRPWRAPEPFPRGLFYLDVDRAWGSLRSSRAGRLLPARYSSVPLLTVYFTGIPDATPELTTAEALDRYFATALARRGRR